MEQDFIFVFLWYSVLLILGLVFLPLTFRIFENFTDRGFIFSKIVATLFISYAVFILSITKTLPFANTTIFFVIFFFLLINCKIGKIKKIIKEKWKLFLFEEMLFFILLVFWAFIKAHEPSIHTLEKFMDFGFVNSNLRTDYLPAPDMWFTPLKINYYYFGHFIAALLTKISNIPANITYNLMLSTLFAYTFTLIFSIALSLFTKIFRNKLKDYLAPLLTASLVTLSGNLQTIYAFFSSYTGTHPPLNKLNFLPLSFPNNYWYPSATRFIPFTIHEFPIYSFVVSDLHGHVSDIPFVLFAIALSLEIFISRQIKFLKLLLFSLLVAVMYMTNAWDAIIYSMLAFLTIVALNFAQTSRESKTLINFILKISKSIKKSIPQIVFLIFASIIFSIPFSINFKPFVSGIGIICAPSFLTKIGNLGPLLFEPNHCQKSDVWQLAILYGFFYFFVVLFFVFLLKTKKQLNREDFFVTLLIFLASLLIIFPEFFYVKDIYPDHYRANTMFKLVYQSFIMLSIATGYIIKRLFSESKNILLFVSTTILLTFVFLYPLFAIGSYYDGIKNYNGLNGILYLKKSYPDDFDAINWINKNIKGQPVILEAQGDSYSDYARISANTGLPTVLGWTVHEWLWRGSYDIPAPRIADVKTLYTTTDISLTRQLLKKYNVSYIYLGDLERQKYTDLFDDKLKGLGKIIFQKNNTRIYKIEKFTSR